LKWNFLRVILIYDGGNRGDFNTQIQTRSGKNQVFWGMHQLITCFLLHLAEYPRLNAKFQPAYFKTEGGERCYGQTDMQTIQKFISNFIKTKSVKNCLSRDHFTQFYFRKQAKREAKLSFFAQHLDPKCLSVCSSVT